MDAQVIWSLVLFAVGLLIAVVEVVLPSGGLLAVAALASLAGSLACAYQFSGVYAAILAGVEAVAVPGVVFAAFKVLPGTSLGRQLILSPPKPKPAGDAPPKSSTGRDSNPYASLLHRTGVAVTMLRPSGTAEVEGRRVSVVSSGEVIPEGAKLKVILVEGNRIVVEPVKG